MRGEYNDWNTDKATEQGSPPLARGIPLYLSDEDKEMGITPACAGNTTMEATLQLGIRDHPRLRGEYQAQFFPLVAESGSPPLARGIPDVILSIVFLNGITPACAGNTVGAVLEQRYLWDHPRLRGEYTEYNNRKKQQSGSPPLARGILIQRRKDSFVKRITPACAGNTLELFGGIGSPRDHPRLRGEYTKKIPYLQPFPDLHL